MIRHLAPLFAFCAVMSCGSPTAVVSDFEFGQPFWLSSGGQALSADRSTLVEVTRISDSICRPGQLCFWEGEVVAEITVRRIESSVAQTATLHSVVEPREAHLNLVGRSIALLKVGGTAGATPTDARWRLQLVVTPSALR